MKNVVIIVAFLWSGCGTDNLKKDTSIALNGPIQISLKLDNTDSILHVGDKIKFSYSMPTVITTRDSVMISNIVNVEFGVGPRVYQVDSINNLGYYKESHNLISGYAGSKSEMNWSLRKGVHYFEDTYVCNDTGVFWFSFVPSATLFYIWTNENKYFRIPITQDFDVPDRHTEMLLRSVPGLTIQLDYEMSAGFGHYCFKVAP